MELVVDQRFAPFHHDARCSILPEGLISENYVECDPGTRSSPPLPAGPTGTPTVPLANTSVPVSVQDVINIFSLPVDLRLRVLVSELGIGTAGRGQDINAILRRANPSLTQAQLLLATLAKQRDQLRAIVTDTNRVIGALEQRDSGVRGFVDQGAHVGSTIALHYNSLRSAIADLPGTLAALRRGSAALDRTTTAATPLLDELRMAAPGLTELTSTLPAFATAGTPALRALEPALAAGRRVLTPAQPVVSHLATLASGLPTTALLTDRTLRSVRDNGGFEGLIKFAYAYANYTSAYDGTSHIGSMVTQVAAKCFLDATQPGCEGQYYAPEHGLVPINETPLDQGPAKPATRQQLSSLLRYLLGR
jgi:ABC-type transporter Mla subunit MlaD